jgi:hypothetical protein
MFTLKNVAIFFSSLIFECNRSKTVYKRENSRKSLKIGQLLHIFFLLQTKTNFWT